MIPASELAEAQEDLNRMLVDQVRVLRPTSTQDAGGGRTTLWNAVATVQAKADADLSQAERDVADRVEFTRPVTFKLPAGTDVTNKDRLEYQGAQYEVGGVLVPRSWELVRRVVAQRAAQNVTVQP